MRPTISLVMLSYAIAPCVGSPPAGIHRDLTEHCLGLVFMAAAPRGVVVLDFEAEENAILDATGTLGLSLIVEESGNPDHLAERLAEVGTMQVLHLSCHRRSQPVPALLLETDEGESLPTPAAGQTRAVVVHKLVPQLWVALAYIRKSG